MNYICVVRCPMGKFFIQNYVPIIKEYGGFAIPSSKT